MISVSIVGVGRVGGGLALSLPREKYTVSRLVYQANADGAIAVAGAMQYSPEVLRLNEAGDFSTDIVFITTQDSQIKTTANDVAGRIAPSATVYHTSGAIDSSILEGAKNAGCSVGSIHPLVSISRPEVGPSRFRDAYFCIEGDESAVDLAKDIVIDLGGRPFEIDTKFKTLYHAAAVTACGHLVALFDASVEMMTKCGLEAETAKEILLPLVTSTVRNLDEQSIAAALTGTFARADTDTFTRHITALNENVSDSLLEIYLLLGERSLELAAKQGVSAERIDTLRTKVTIAKSKLKW